jgi:hypothetical protein
MSTSGCSANARAIDRIQAASTRTSSSVKATMSAVAVATPRLRA